MSWIPWVTFSRLTQGLPDAACDPPEGGQQGQPDSSVSQGCKRPDELSHQKAQRKAHVIQGKADHSVMSNDICRYVDLLYFQESNLTTCINNLKNIPPI